MATENGRNQRTVFIDTNLETHLVTIVSDSDTVSHLKRRIAIEHRQCFPAIGDVKIHSVKIKQKGNYYHLSDSSLVKFAFGPNQKNLHISVDAYHIDQQFKEDRSSNLEPDLEHQLDTKAEEKLYSVVDDDIKSKKRVLDDVHNEDTCLKNRCKTHRKEKEEDRVVTVGIEMEKDMSMNDEDKSKSKDVVVTKAMNDEKETKEIKETQEKHVDNDGQVLITSQQNAEVSEKQNDNTNDTKTKTKKKKKKKSAESQPVG